MAIPDESALASVTPFEEASFYEALVVGNDYVTAAEVAENPRANYLQRYLSALRVSTMVVERPYVDGDYLEDFSAFYVSCFPKYQRWCTRVHFFKLGFDQDAFEAALKGEGDLRPDDLRENYVGFVVARPLPEAVIGRTVLKTYPPDGSRRNYPAKRLYTANLFGLKLEIDGLAYQEQDRVMAACATVALWSALHKTSDLFNTGAPRPAVITRTANLVVHPGRPIPSHGLDVRQICKAILEVGLDPEVFEIGQNTPLPSLLYAHLRAGLPVLLGVDVEGIGLHAVALCGYSLRDDEHLTAAEESAGTGLPMIGRRIDEFYAHDDQIGPYCRMKVNPPTTVGARQYPIYFDKSWKDGRGHRRLLPTVAIVPVYRKIRVTFLDVREWLLHLDALLALVIGKDVDREWDLHLTTTQELKEQLFADREIEPQERLGFLFAPQPRFIWRAALTSHGKEVLELWADATDIARSLPIFRFVWRSAEYRVRCWQWLETEPLHERIQSLLTRRLWERLRRDTKP